MSFEKAVSYLREKGMEDRVIVPEASSATVELAAQAIGVTPGEIAKTLSLLTKEGPVLVIAEGTARVDNRKYKDTFHQKARMIPGDQVEELVGHAPGVSTQAFPSTWMRACANTRSFIPPQATTTAP